MRTCKIGTKHNVTADEIPIIKKSISFQNSLTSIKLAGMYPLEGKGKSFDYLGNSLLWEAHSEMPISHRTA